MSDIDFDVIDRLAGLAANAPLAAIRAARTEARDNAQKSYIALFAPEVPGTVLAEASLSFLGIGMPPGTPSWGSLLSFGRDVLLEAPHVATFPGIAIAVTILGFHLLGEGLRQRLDPRSGR